MSGYMCQISPCVGVVYDHEYDLCLSHSVEFATSRARNGPGWSILDWATEREEASQVRRNREDNQYEMV